MSKGSSGGNGSISKLANSLLGPKTQQNQSFAGPSSSLLSNSQQQQFNQFLSASSASAGIDTMIMDPQSISAPIFYHPNGNSVPTLQPHQIQNNTWNKEFIQNDPIQHYQIADSGEIQYPAAIENGWHLEFASQPSTNNSIPAQNNHAPIHPVIGPLHHRPVYQPSSFLRSQMQPLPNEQINEIDWNIEFEARQREMKTEQKTEEESKNVIAVDEKDALAKTAGVLADIIQESSNPKFQNSKFLTMMQQLRDKEIAIEGDKVVQQIPPVEAASATQPELQDMNRIYQNTRTELKHDSGSFAQTNKIPSSFEMAQEFLTSNGQGSAKNWEEDFMAQDFTSSPSLTHYYKDAPAPPRNYNNAELSSENQKKYQAEPSSDELIQQFSSDVSHDMDWSGEFRSRLDHLESDSVRERRLYEDDIKESMTEKTGVENQEEWANEFNKKLNLENKVEHLQEAQLNSTMTPEEAQAQWRDWEKLYEVENPDTAINQDPQISEYEFVSGNPFLQAPTALLSSASHENNVIESILCLEATVQRDPQNSQAWLDLGKKQQENENETAAVAALKKAIDLDSKNLDAYLAISVSYTNENLTSQAQHALRDWLQQNPKYSHIPLDVAPYSTSSEIHEKLTNAYVQAATLSIYEVDADVQQALGVLFAIANDYSKAIDCFRTAVSCRPNDYQLWNKLGATFANSGDSEKAMESYFNAIQISPLYIRARYNLAIACMQMGQYHEAAGYLLSALSIQEESLKQVNTKTKPELVPEMRNLHTGQSESVWNGLKMLISSYIRREDLSEACDARDLNAFRNEFDF